MDNIAYLLDEKASPWARALALVREECSEFGAAFFDAVGFEGFFEGCVCLTVPDSFRATWLNSHYGALLRKTFTAVYGSDFVDYKVRVLDEKGKTDIYSYIFNIVCKVFYMSRTAV